MKKILKDTFALFLITVISGLLLGLVYKVTKEPIERKNEETKLNAYKSVFTSLDHTELFSDELMKKAQDAVNEGKLSCVTLDEAVRVYDADDYYLGMIITVTDSCGYGGDIRMTVGIDSQGVITGLEFLEINETAGLGMKAKEASFREQFTGMKTEYVTCVGNTGAAGEYDAISSATITSSAVGDGVNGALICYRTIGGDADE